MLIQTNIRVNEIMKTLAVQEDTLFQYREQLKKANAANEAMVLKLRKKTPNYSRLTESIPHSIWSVFATEEDKKREKVKKLRDWHDLQIEAGTINFEDDKDILKGDGNSDHKVEKLERNHISTAAGGLFQFVNSLHLHTLQYR